MLGFPTHGAWRKYSFAFPLTHPCNTFVNLRIVVAFVCVTIVIGCSSGGKSSTAEIAGKECPELLRVERFAMIDETLRLDYRVTNTFPHDIWVCTTLNAYPRRELRMCNVETRIAGPVLRIKCGGNMEQNLLVQESTVVAAYKRLPPGHSRSDAVLLTLPVRTISPVYEAHEPFARAVLNQVVLELGYFGKETPGTLPRDPKRASLEDPDTAIIHYIEPNKWEGLAHEHLMQATISDVAVPGVRGGFLERLGHGVASEEFPEQYAD